MTTECTITATCLNGKPLDVLGDLVKKRSKLLRETTAQASKATAINILTSLRAATKTASPNKKNYGVVVVKNEGVVPGFKSNKGSHKGRRVVRVEGGHEIQGAKFANKAGKYQRGETVFAFTAILKYPRWKDIIVGDKYERIYIIARSEKDAVDYCNDRLRKYIAKYSGMAKWALGQIQSQIAVASLPNIKNIAKLTAIKNITVREIASGFDNGEYSIYVNDGLDYAASALKGGVGDVEKAYKKAANKTYGLIRRFFAEHPRLDEDIGQTPFPEVQKK